MPDTILGQPIDRIDGKAKVTGAAPRSNTSIHEVCRVSASNSGNVGSRWPRNPGGGPWPGTNGCCPSHVTPRSAPSGTWIRSTRGITFRGGSCQYV